MNATAYELAPAIIEVVCEVCAGDPEKGIERAYQGCSARPATAADGELFSMREPRELVVYCDWCGEEVLREREEA